MVRERSLGASDGGYCVMAAGNDCGRGAEVTELHDWSLRAMAAEVETCAGVAAYRLRRPWAWEALGSASIARRSLLPACCETALGEATGAPAEGWFVTCGAGHSHALFGLPSSGDWVDLFEETPNLEAGELLRLGQLLLRSAARLQRLARLAQAGDLDERKANFAGVVSHELRTPLTALQGLSELLLEGVYGELGPEQAAAVYGLHQHAGALRDLVEQVLEAAQVERGAQKQPAESVCFESLVRSELAIAGQRQGGQFVRFEAEPALPWLTGEPVQLRRIVRALLDNAFKFGRVDGVLEVQVRRACGAEGRPGLHLVIRHDSEPLVPLSELRLRDWFEQGDASRTRRHGGLGLGLYLVTSFVAAHAGTFELQEDGPQVEAAVWLPLPSEPDALRCATMLRH